MTAAGLAVVTHVLVVWLLLVTGFFARAQPVRDLMLVNGEPQQELERQDQPMEIESLVQQVDRPLKETEQEHKKKQEEESTKIKGQVVDIARPAIEQAPDQTKFLSEYDSKVLREQKGQPGKDQAGAKEPTTPVPPQAPERSKQQRLGVGKGEPLDPLAMRTPQRESEDHQFKEVGPDGTLQGKRPQIEPDLHRSGGAAGAARPSLMATPDVLQRAIGQGSGSPDYLGDLDEGDATALNAKKWKFATFFNRLKRQVSDEWKPEDVLKRHDPSGNIYGVKERVTVLRVHLKPDGRLERIEVLKSSDVYFLDDEAMSAFKRAQPFVNPPPQLVEADGFITFNFGFIYQIGGATNFKYWRYKE